MVSKILNIVERKVRELEKNNEENANHILQYTISFGKTIKNR